MKHLFCLLLLVLILPGCSFVSAYDKERGTGFRAVMPAWPWQDSARVVDRINVSSKTNSFTASIHGLNDTETTSTNAVNLLESAVGAAVGAAVRAVAPVPK